MLKLQEKPVVGRYARALLAAASDDGSVDVVRRKLSELQRILGSMAPLAAALRHPQVPRGVKRDLLQRILGRGPAVLDRFLEILLEKKRWDALPEIVPAFERLADEASGVLAVRAESAAPLSAAEQDALRRALEKGWKGPVSLRTAVKEDLLAGLVLRVGDRLWDNSLKAQLERLREAWLPGGSPQLLKGT